MFKSFLHSNHSLRPRVLTGTLLASSLLPIAAWSQGGAPATPERTDCSGAEWAPAHAENFQPANRPLEGSVEYVVIHDIEGPAGSAVAWFKNAKAQASSHYVVGPGKVWQMVRERDIAWHAGNKDINTRSIGIEHEGFAYRPGFYNGELYESSAKLVREITSRYGIPRDRQHLIAHAEVPHPTDPSKFGGKSQHTDPGPWWNWDYYMTLVRNEAAVMEVKAPTVIHPGEKLPVTIVMENRGDDPWPALTRKGRNLQAEAAGPVYLAVDDKEPLPLRVESPVFDSATWTSPRYIVGASAAVAPGDRGTFTAMLQGPRQFGEVRESLRLSKVPPAPHMPVPFGPAIPLTLTVKPWEFVVDTNSPGFSARDWEMREEDGVKKVTRKFKKGQAADLARWSMPLPVDGLWEVQARWPGGKGRTKRAVYEIAAAGGVQQVTVDPRKAPQQNEGWQTLGRFRFSGGKPVAAITLRPEKDGRVDADAVRLRGPFPQD